MSQSEIKSIYDSLKESGDFELLFPNLTGDWLEDKKEFISQYNSNEEILKDFDDGIEDISEFEF